MESSFSSVNLFELFQIYHQNFRCPIRRQGERFKPIIEIHTLIPPLLLNIFRNLNAPYLDNKTDSADTRSPFIGKRSDNIPYLLILEKEELFTVEMLEVFSTKYRVQKITAGLSQVVTFLHEFTPDCVFYSMDLADEDKNAVLRVIRNDRLFFYMLIVVFGNIDSSQIRLGYLMVGADDNLPIL